MFHHGQTLHCTAPNETDRQRRAFAIHYMNPGTHRIGHGKAVPMDVSFANPLLRSA